MEIQLFGARLDRPSSFRVINEGQKEIERGWDKILLLEIDTEHMTGKAAIEIIKQQDQSY